MFTEIVTDATTDTSLRLVENHYPVPLSNAINSLPDAVNAEIPVPSAPPLSDHPSLSSLSEIIQVGFIILCEIECLEHNDCQSTWHVWFNVSVACFSFTFCMTFKCMCSKRNEHSIPNTSRCLLPSKLSPLSCNICIKWSKITLHVFSLILRVLNFTDFAGFYFWDFNRQICTKGIKFCSSSILNFILFFKSLNFLAFLNKLRQAKTYF